MNGTKGIGDDLGLVEIFATLGLRFMQLTYNNQSLLGSGWQEPRDGGITNFGREVLFSYLVALYIALFGATSNAMYVVSAWVGIATVPAVFLLADELFSGEEVALRR